MPSVSQNCFRRVENRINIAPAMHMRRFVSSIGDFVDCAKKSCAATPELAQNIPAIATVINAKFFFKPNPSDTSKQPADNSFGRDVDFFSGGAFGQAGHRHDIAHEHDDETCPRANLEFANSHVEIFRTTELGGVIAQ